MEAYNKYLKTIESKIGNTTTTETQLDRLGRQLFDTEWSGVFPADRVEMTRRYAIANFDSSDETGSHWVAVVKASDNIFIYDSFGRSEWDDDAEQTIVETNCGQRCLAWLLVVHNHGIEKALKI